MTGLNASAGISYNKFLAKLASDYRKPNGQYTITPEAGPAFVETLPVGRFHGIGPATNAKMNSLGLHIGLDMRNQTLEFMQAIHQNCRPGLPLNSACLNGHAMHETVLPDLVLPSIQE